MNFTCDFKTCHMESFEIHFMISLLALFHVARGCMTFAEVVNTNLYDQDSYPSLVAVARTSPDNQN